MTSMMDLYQKKYTILKRKCEELHQNNEKLVNRIHHVKKILKRYKKERRMMVEELDKYSDDFRDTEIPPMYELPEEQMDPDLVQQTPGKPDATLEMLPPPKQEPLEKTVPTPVKENALLDTSSLMSPSAATRAVPQTR